MFSASCLSGGAVGLMCNISLVRLVPNKEEGTKYRKYLSGRMNHFFSKLIING
jgi:hypothetical protein